MKYDLHIHTSFLSDRFPYYNDTTNNFTTEVDRILDKGQRMYPKGTGHYAAVIKEKDFIQLKNIISVSIE